MNTQEKIEAAGKKKEEGNLVFKAGKYARASKRYEKVSATLRCKGSSFELDLRLNFEMLLILNYRLQNISIMITLLVRKRKSSQKH